MENISESPLGKSILNISNDLDDTQLQDKSTKSDNSDECNSTETSCSINSNDCIEYDSDVLSDDSVFFYSESDTFIDNRFLRINHKPFLKLLKDREVNAENKNENFVCPSSMSRLLDSKIFDEIDKLNVVLEKEYEKLKNIFEKSVDQQTNKCEVNSVVNNDTDNKIEEINE